MIRNIKEFIKGIGTAALWVLILAAAGMVAVAEFLFNKALRGRRKYGKAEKKE